MGTRTECAILGHMAVGGVGGGGPSTKTQIEGAWILFAPLVVGHVAPGLLTDHFSREAAVWSSENRVLAS